jgi:hypothetical protein
MTCSSFAAAVRRVWLIAGVPAVAASARYCPDLWELLVVSSWSAFVGLGVFTLQQYAAAMRPNFHRLCQLPPCFWASPQVELRTQCLYALRCTSAVVLPTETL